MPVLGTNRISTIPVRIEEKDKEFWVYAPYNIHLLAEEKAIAGGKWGPEASAWHFPITERNIYHFQILEGWKDEHYKSDQHTKYADLVRSIYPDLFPWQPDGIGFILAKLRVMLAFTMGLGKTLACIRMMEIVQGWNVTAKQIGLPYQPALRWWLLAPRPTLRSWLHEIKKWRSPIQFEVMSTYESLHLHMDREVPDGVILDESIKIKNHAAKRSQYTSELCRNIRENNGYIVELSGAPSPKLPTDWWHQIECLQPGYIREGNIHKMRDRYADIEWEDGPYGRFPKEVVWKPSEVRSLGKRLSGIVMVRDKKDCLDLPEKIYDEIELPVDEETEQLAKFYVEESPTAIQALIRLRTLSDGFVYEGGYEEDRHPVWLGSPKLDIVKDLLEQYAQENEGCGRLVIYAAFRGSIDKIVETVNEADTSWKPYVIDGRGMNKDVLDIFDNSSYNICIVAHPGCVHGLNLQKTEALVYYSNDFSSDFRTQSEDRRDRPGMKMIGTRVIDLLHLPIDKHILEIVRGQIDLHSLTLEEIKKWV